MKLRITKVLAQLYLDNRTLKIDANELEKS